MRDEGKRRDTTEDDERLALDAFLSPGEKRPLWGDTIFRGGGDLSRGGIFRRAEEKKRRVGESAGKIGDAVQRERHGRRR